MKIVILGSGNVATHLTLALSRQHNILTVYSRNRDNAEQLANKIKTKATNSIKEIPATADIYIIAVNDDAIGTVVDDLPQLNGIVAHTAGSIPIEALNKFSNHGVFYPFQTFSKDKDIDLSNVPILIEGNNAETFQKLNDLAVSVTNKIYNVNSAQRLTLHISAVFACNFVNYFYHIAETLLKEADLPFELLLPLIDETAQKVHITSPLNAQTGPAIRNDRNTIQKHLKVLQNAGANDLADIYSKHSKEISELYRHDNPTK